jgi:metallo-beta-lactamase class B
MKATLAATLSVGILSSIAFPATSATAAELSLSHLTGPIYLVEDNHYVTTNSLIYIGTSSVTVIGATWTPDTAKSLVKLIERLTNRPISEVIDTSPDPEWSGGNAYWASIGAKIIAVEATYDYLERNWVSTVEAFRKNFPAYPQLPLVLPTKIYPTKFELQNGKVQAFFLGPSHTPGDIFVYFPKQKVLDAGSIIKEQLGNMTKADVEEYPNTLHKLQELHLDIQTIISGHWSPVHGPDLIDHYLRLLQLAERDDAHHKQR